MQLTQELADSMTSDGICSIPAGEWEVETPIILRDGVTFVGEPGALLRGPEGQPVVIRQGRGDIIGLHYGGPI